MDTFKICVFRSITSLGQSFKSSLHQRAYTAAQNRLLTKQVGLSLSPESGLQQPCSCASNSQSISHCQVFCLAGSVLMHCDQAGSSSSSHIFASYSMSGSLGSDHGNIHILRRNDLSKMDSKAVGEHQHHARAQIGFNRLLVHRGLLLIIN